MTIKRFLFLDFETYYDAEYSLRKLSVPEYILDKRYETIMLAAYDLEWSAPKIILAHEIFEFLSNYPKDETIACSHNALFDMSILAWRYGYVPGRLQDSLGMVRALRNYKRNSLGAVAEQLFGHDSKGDTIHKVKGMHAQDIKNTGLWPDFCTYAMNDVRLCAQIYRKLFPEFPIEEQLVMDLVLRAAVLPTLHVDIHMLQSHLNDIRKEKYRLLQECNYDKAALMSTAQFKAALEGLGVEVATKVSPKGREIPAFAKTDPFMGELLEHEDPKVQTLAMARLSHKSTIEETRCQKFLNVAMLPWGTWEADEGPIPAHLLPVPLRYGGALTHRLSGEWGMNLQNLPRDQHKSKLRSSLIAPPGYKLVSADLSQIEARIVAVLCGQDDLAQAFRDGEDVYALFASRVFGKTISKTKNPNERFIGKTAILGLGYGCGHERFYNMVVTQARQYGIPLEGLFDDLEAQKIVNTYRGLFSCIPDAWRMLDRELACTINTHNTTQFSDWGPVRFTSGNIKLPNKMSLRYQVGEMDLYGAKILENITQALARIVIMQAGIRLSQQGLRFVLQAHDELVFVVPDQLVHESIPVIADEMTKEPSWLPGLPLAVEVGVGQDYGSCK